MFKLNPFSPLLDDMDYTMLRQMARLGRLLARQHDAHDEQDSVLKGLDNILDPEDKSKTRRLATLDDAQLAQFLANKKHEMTTRRYDLILKYLASVGEHKLNFWGSRNAAGVITLPDPEHRSMILPPRARQRKKCYVDKRTYSCNSSHRGNSLIQFYEPGTDRKDNHTLTGVINTILQVPLDGFLRTFILIQKHRPVHIQSYSDHPELMTAGVYAEPEPDLIVIEPKHIITHLSTWKRTAEIHNTDEPVLLVCWALNRGRR